MTPTPVIPILIYHSIAPDANTDWRQYTVPPELFAEHLRFLQEHDYCSLTVAALASLLRVGLTPPPNPVVLTFDDGHGDFATCALPLLERFGITATVYITTEFVGRRSPWTHRRGEPPPPMLSWSDLRTVCDAGIECGAHGVTHTPLDVLAREDALKEIVASKQRIQDALGVEVATFAYPHGRYDAGVRQMVIDAGYAGACSTSRAMSNPADDLFGLARIPVGPTTTIREFADLLVGRGLPLAPVPERWRTRVWRFARRQMARVRPGSPALPDSR